MRSKSLMTLTTSVTASTDMGRLTIGRIIRKKICRSFAPSTCADSMTSAGMLFTAADRMTVANPTVPTPDRDEREVDDSRIAQPGNRGYAERAEDRVEEPDVRVR